VIWSTPSAPPARTEKKEQGGTEKRSGLRRIRDPSSPLFLCSSLWIFSGLFSRNDRFGADVAGARSHGPGRAGGRCDRRARRQLAGEPDVSSRRQVRRHPARRTAARSVGRGAGGAGGAGRARSQGDRRGGARK